MRPSPAAQAQQDEDYGEVLDRIFAKRPPLKGTNTQGRTLEEEIKAGNAWSGIADALGVDKV